MEKVTSLVYELFDALEGIESPLLVLEIILTAVMTRAIKKNTNASNTCNVTPAANNAAPAVAPTETPTAAPTTTVKDKNLARKQLINQLMFDVDLLFSDKPDDELSEEETARVSRLLSYIEDLKK